MQRGAGRVITLSLISALGCGALADGGQRRPRESAEPSPPAAEASDAPLDVTPGPVEQPVSFEPRGAGECELQYMERMVYHYCSACHTLMPSFAVPIDCFADCDAPPPPVSFAELVDSGNIVPGSAAASRLIIRQRDGSMPPPRSGRAPPSEAELSALESFIDSLDPEQELSCETGE